MASRIEIVEHSVVSGHVRYTLLVALQNESKCHLQVRYSELRRFKDSIFNIPIALPSFPPKRCCGNLNPAFIEQRTAALNNYFNTLCTLKRVVNSKQFKEFFFFSDKKVLIEDTNHSEN